MSIVFCGASLGRWPKDDPHTPERRYVEVWIRFVILGRQFELKVTL